MRKYVVIKEKLNIRNRPLLQDEFYIGFARLGEELWLDETNIIEGDAPAGTQDRLWLPDANGNVVAKSGVREQTYEEKKLDFLKEQFALQFIDTADKTNEAKWKISWGHVDTEVWKLWQKGMRGQGVRVAILDTGVDYSHGDLQTIKGVMLQVEGDKVIATNEFLDFMGHGTNCCGLAGATGAAYYTGLAPESEIFAIKLYDTSLPTDKKSIYLLLKKAFDLVIAANKTSEKFDFVSMSFSASDKDLDGTDDLEGKPWLTVLQEKVDIISRTSFILCSVGKYDVSYPERFNNVYVVEGADKIKNTLSSPADKSKLIYAPAGDNLKTTALTNRNPPYLLNFTGSSAATAFTAGYFALNYSRIKDGSEAKRKIFSDAIHTMLQEYNNHLGPFNSLP
ncbi:MAG: S8/S53 family peptidase [Agriterribacter sp.]